MMREGKRVARVSPDFVQPGDMIWREYPSAQTGKTVSGFYSVRMSRAAYGEAAGWTIHHSGGLSLLRTSDVVEIEDDTGLKQLRYDVTRIGPYVTTTTFNPEKAGAIHFANVRTCGPSIVLADLIVRRDDETLCVLEAVELGHLYAMAHELEREVRADDPAPIGGGSATAKSVATRTAPDAPRP